MVLEIIKARTIKVHLAIAAFILSITNPAFAESKNLGDIASGITDSFSSVAKMISGGAYIAGFALTMVGIMKLKAHKDNPTQIPISTGFALIFVGAALVAMPLLLGVGITTIFGSDADTSGLTAHGTDSLPGQ